MVLACVNNSQSQHSGLEPHRKGHLKDYPLLLVNVACHNLLQVKLEFDNEVGELQSACPSKKAEHFTVGEWTDTPESPCHRFTFSKMKVIMTFLKICQDKVNSSGNKKLKEGLSKIIDSLKEQWTAKDGESLKSGLTSSMNAFDRSYIKHNAQIRSVVNDARKELQNLKLTISNEPTDERLQQFQEKLRKILSSIKIKDNSKIETEKTGSDDQGSEAQEESTIAANVARLGKECFMTEEAKNTMYAFTDKPFLSELKPKVLEVFPKSAFPEKLNVTVNIKKIVVPPKSENTPL